MRYSASEKLEIIRLVEQSSLPVKRTLEKLGIPRATFYRWYDLYRSGGPEALSDRSPRPGRVWNRIPDVVRQRIIKPAVALGSPGHSPPPLVGTAVHSHTPPWRSRSSRHASSPCASPIRKTISCQ